MPISARLVRILVTLNTTFLLMAQYNGKAIVPLADVCRDYFSHLAPEKLFRKVMAGQIPLPIVGLGLGLLLAVLSGSPSRLVRIAVRSVVELGRGSPALVILYFVYFGLPQAGLITEAFTSGVLALGFSAGAYMSEIFRAALLAVPAGQREAAGALAFGRWHAFAYIILPQAVRIAIPATLSYTIILFQVTSLCFVISVPELMSRAYGIASITFQYGSILSLTALIYATITIVASVMIGRIAHRMDTGRG